MTDTDAEGFLRKVSRLDPYDGEYEAEEGCEKANDLIAEARKLMRRRDPNAQRLTPK